MDVHVYVYTHDNNDILPWLGFETTEFLLMTIQKMTLFYAGMQLGNFVDIQI